MDNKPKNAVVEPSMSLISKMCQGVVCNVIVMPFVLLLFSISTAFSATKPITRVLCDNEYGWAMEEAIVKGNASRVAKLLAGRDHSAINDVIAVGDEGLTWKTVDKECVFWLMRE